MPSLVRLLAIVGILVGAGTTVGDLGHDWRIEPRPPTLNPPKVSAARHTHYQALKLYLHGRVCQSDRRLPDAVRAYEEALQLEPKVIGIYKALIPLCFHLERHEQALEYCRKAIALDPNDYELLFRYGRELQQRGQMKKAVEALTKAVSVPAARKRPDEFAVMCFSLAVLHEDLQQYPQAAQAYEQVAKTLEQADPDNFGPFNARQISVELAKTYERLGRVELKAEHFDKAVAAFAKAQEKDPLRAGRLHYNLAEVHLAKKDLKQALEHLRKYIQTQPTGTEAYELMITILAELKRQDEIVPALEDAAKQDRFNQSLKLLLAKHYVEAQMPNQAEPIYLAAWKENPEEETYQGLARLYAQQGRWADLVKILDHDLGDPRRLVSAQPQIRTLASESALVKGIATAALALPADAPPLALNTRKVLASLCRQARLHEHAERFCRQCLADDPNAGDVYLELCRILSEAKKHEAEAEVCREALTKKLKVPALVFQLELARSLALAGKDQEAIAAAKDAVKETVAKTEDHFRARYTLVIVHYRCNQLDKALEEGKKLLAQATEPKEKRQVHYILSGIHGARKDHRHAEEHLQEVLKIDPEDATANNDLGYLWADQGKNLDEAEKLIRKAIELDRAERVKKKGMLEKPGAEQDNAAYIDSLGWVLYQRGREKEKAVGKRDWYGWLAEQEGQGDCAFRPMLDGPLTRAQEALLREARQFFEQAAEHLEQAAKVDDGDDPVIFDHLGEVYRRLNEFEKARKAWEKALELYKTNKRVGQDDRRKELEGRLQLLSIEAILQVHFTIDK